MSGVEPAAGGRRLLTVEQAAARLGVSRRVIELMIRNGRIVCHQTGERYGYRIPAAEVERLLAEKAGARPAAGEARAARAGDGWPSQAKRIREELEAIAVTLRGLTEHVRAVEAALDAREEE